MEAILANYCYTPDWVSNYPGITSVTILDNSDDGIERNLQRFGKVFKFPNMGDADFLKLSYLIENYNNLPEVFLWGKSNIFKYVDKELFDKSIQGNQFTPLLKFDHKTYSDQFGVVCRYAGPIYEERADSWFFNNPALSVSTNWTWEKWAWTFGLPRAGFIPFAPGGNYILTRETVHKQAKEFYEALRDTLPYAMHPAEAHACERSYYSLWK